MERLTYKLGNNYGLEDKDWTGNQRSMDKLKG